MQFTGRDAKGFEHYQCSLCGQRPPRPRPARTDPNVVHLDDATYWRLFVIAWEQRTSVAQIMLHALREWSQLSVPVQHALVRDYYDANRPTSGWLAALRALGRL